MDVRILGGVGIVEEFPPMKKFGESLVGFEEEVA